MAILPIPACLETMPFGVELQQGLIFLCALFIFLSFIPFLGYVLFCGWKHITDNEYHDMDMDLLCLIFMVVVLVCVVLGESTPSIVHFILNVIWWVVTIFYIVFIVYLIVLFFTRKEPCVTSWVIAIIARGLCLIDLLVGIPVYWSYYVEISD